jgi:hypothetical protein
MNIKGCSVHGDQESQQPREHRDPRGRGGVDSYCPPNTGVLMCGEGAQVRASWTVLVTGPILSKPEKSPNPLSR